MYDLVQVINVFILYYSTITLPAYAPFRVSFTSLCVCTINHLCVSLEYRTLLAYAFKLSYCTLLA